MIPRKKKYSIKLLRGNTMVITKEFLKSSNVPDIGSIIIYLDNYINESNNLTEHHVSISFITFKI